ncbi:glycosyltransferase family 4 protein [Vibrio alfacsensis]|uniref:glycosyltransferase family 4 protein n=1 Tax=Vibrio TaxID=662 RepID=UPI004067E486
MKILLISHFFPPSNAIASQRIKSFAKYWSESGHQVTVLTTKKGNNESQPDYCNLIETEYLPTLAAKRIQKVKSEVLLRNGQTKVSIKKSLFNFINDYGAFSSIRFPDITSLWPFFINYEDLNGKEKFDVIVSSHGPYTCHHIAYRLMKKGIGKKWIMDYRDLWSDNYMYQGLPFFKYFERTTERKYLKFADSVVTVSSPLADKLRSLGANNVFVIENGYEESELSTRKTEQSSYAETKFTLSYFGALYPTYRDPEVLCKAVKRLIDEDRINKAELQVDFYGSGEHLVAERASEYGLSGCISFKGSVSRSEVAALQNRSDMLFLIDSSKEAGVLTTKVFEYLTTRLPVVAIGVSDNGELAKLLRQFEDTYSLKCDIELANTIEYYFKLKKKKGSQVRRQDLGPIGDYTRSALAKRFASLF